ncbi:polymer-forming cytoskeletal protein [Patescibacteria group bacterium]|nr:polymer-forming cytoskeletal protein [Candidatus Falkowbacteria bacterium]MBU3906021.1 polymer-forming cytoskeletal protein [Patescibacteria group bacterium]MCG2695773.1 polymer-forming cytoskeletal protein [Candidatus Parcubacteria bacterium]MBU4015094.1 polymer-forming cytoskeletal protein [Patescibacteria group bacterium]MBU4026780.1 polymer-forming cytoskeletal protein [Patescibacteria group bacterium]
MFGKNKYSTTIIDSSAKLEGKLSSLADLVVSGKIDGMIENTKNVKISKSAMVKADIKANSIIVAGKAEGNVEAKEKLHITKTGWIKGGIKCKILSIERGGMINGQCLMSVEAQAIKEKADF